MISSRHIVLIGPMGSGKTTIGVNIAHRAGRPFLDSDAIIQRQHGRTSGRIADEEGVPKLHALEAATFIECLQQPSAVIAPAASVLDNQDCRAALKDHATFALAAPIDVLVNRIGRDSHRRAISEADLATAIDRRGPATDEVCLATFDTSLHSPEAIAQQILTTTGV